MKIYNTLTRKVETFTPQTPRRAGIYTCGPTVYDYAHVGHWFNYVRMDTLIRTLKLSDIRPVWVMNITDVGHLVSDADEGEDKLEKGARREGKTAWEIATFYTQDFLQGMKALNITQPDKMPKATDHIKDQIELIKYLETDGYTYVIDDGVYYDTSRFHKYADFAKLDLDEQQGTGRVQENAQKKQPSDFALWKFSPKNSKRDMEWESPWGKGFPGWHIECSAMSMKYLGETLDVHTGGIDHVPVHHTNEIAQSEAVTGKPYSRYWLHSNHVMISGQKISKSLGNGIRLKDVEEKGISMMAFRLHVLESHYRSHSTFSWESLEAASNRLQRWYDMAVLRHQTRAEDAHESETTGDAVEVIYRQKPVILQALQNDLDTPQALLAVEEVFEAVQNGIPGFAEDGYLKLLEFIDEALGLDLSKQPDLTPDQKKLLHERHSARTDQDWEKADMLRDHLLKEGITVRDVADGQLWGRLIAAAS